MKEIKLESGATLGIGIIPFETSNQLKKVMMRRVKSIPVNSSRQILDLSKDYLCVLLGEDDVEAALWECMKRCTYDLGAGALKIEKNTFEAVEARSDFTQIQIEVGKEALQPFTKGLFVALQAILAKVTESIPQ